MKWAKSHERRLVRKEKFLLLFGLLVPKAEYNVALVGNFQRTGKKCRSAFVS